MGADDKGVTLEFYPPARELKKKHTHTHTNRMIRHTGPGNGRDFRPRFPGARTQGTQQNRYGLEGESAHLRRIRSIIQIM